jgi:succinoglycan biosynthesis transport protein ExoP
LEPARSTSSDRLVEEGVGDLRRYVQVVAQRRWWILGCFLVTVAVAAVYTKWQTPIYEAKTTLLVDTGMRGPSRAEDEVWRTLTGLGRARTLQTQIEIVKSSSRVASAAYLVAARQVVLAAVANGGPNASSPGEGSLGEGWDSARLFVSLPSEAQTYLVPLVRRLHDELGLSPSDLEKLLLSYFRQDESVVSGRYPPGVDEARDKVDAALEAGETTRLRAAVTASLPLVADQCRELLIDCSVQGVRGTDVIAITCRSSVPALAAGYADGVAREHEWRSLMSNREAAKKGAEWVRAQAGRARSELRDRERSLRDVLRGSGLASVSDAARTLTERVGTLTDAVSNAQAAADADQARLAALQRQLSEQKHTVVDTSTTTANPAVAELRDKLTAAEQERAGLLEKVTEAHPSVAEIDARIAEIKRQLQEQVGKTITTNTQLRNPLGAQVVADLAEAQTRLVGDQAQLSALQASLGQAQAELDRVPDVEQQAAQIEREVQIAEKNYLALFDTLQSLSLAQATEVAGASVLDYASVPRSPIHPKPRANLLIAVILGLLIGFALALVIDYLDNTIKDTDEIERLFGLPLLAVIPRVRSGRRPVLEADSESALPEPYRSLYTNLRFVIADGPRKCLLITSPGPTEGKTTTAANLSIVCGEFGQKVALVDTDLRHPSVASVLGLKGEVGVTDCVVDSGALAGALQATPYANVTVLVSGPIPPNPLQVLESEQMRNVIAQLRESNDLVFLDSPPVGLVADAQVLASLSDGVLLVIEIGKTRRPMIAHALELLGRAGARCLGVVVNKAAPRRGRYPYYYHYYGSASRDASP